MDARRMVNRLAFAGLSVLLLAGCGGGSQGAATNAVNVAALTAPPANPSANVSQNDLFQIDNDATNAANTVDPAEAGMLAAKNAECVDQLIRSQPFGESAAAVVDNVTKGCLPIAEMQAEASPTPPANVEASERTFVAARVREMASDTNAAPANAAPANAAAQPAAKPRPPA